MKLFTVLALAEGPSKLAPDFALGLQPLGLLVGREDTPVSCCSAFISCQAVGLGKCAREKWEVFRFVILTQAIPRVDLCKASGESQVGRFR